MPHSAKYTSRMTNNGQTIFEYWQEVKQELLKL
jgi:preprotein translocase subunit SecE